jgi:hypothetical protein
MKKKATLTMLARELHAKRGEKRCQIWRVRP